MCEFSLSYEILCLIYTDTKKELASLKELSETRLQEIEQLKLKLEDNNSMYNTTLI